MKNKNGFTLVELLAVIVIIALIMTVTSTTVMQVLKQSREDLKQEQFEQLVEAGNAYINSVIEKKDTLTPQTKRNNGYPLSGYELIEYAGSCLVSTTNEYCKKEEKTERNKKDPGVKGDEHYDTVYYSTRTIFFDVAALKEYIDIEPFKIKYDKDLLNTTDPSKMEERDKLITYNNNKCGLKVNITVKKTVRYDGYSTGYYELVTSSVIPRTGIDGVRCVK